MHCGILWYPEPGRPARALHEINVIGTLQLLAACERTETLRRVVVRGSAAIYGCEGAAPSFYTEDLAREAPLRTRFQRDISELEEYFDNFARRHPELVCCMLRFQPEVGAGPRQPAGPLPHACRWSRCSSASTLGCSSCTPTTRPGRSPPRSRNPVRGPVNVAPDGLDLAEPGAAAAAAARRVPIPHPLFEPRSCGASAAGSAPAGCPATAYGCCATAAASTTAACARSSAIEPRYDAVGRDPRPGRQGARRGGSARACTRARSPARLDGVRSMSGAAARTAGPRRRRSPSSCAACAAGSSRASTRWPPPSRPPARCPGGCATAVDAIVARLQGDYHEDEWGFDEQFAEAVFPLFEFLYERWWRVETTGVAQRARPTGARCWSPTTPARCSPSTRR